MPEDVPEGVGVAACDAASHCRQTAPLAFSAALASRKTLNLAHVCLTFLDVGTRKLRLLEGSLKACRGSELLQGLKLLQRGPPPSSGLRLRAV